MNLILERDRLDALQQLGLLDTPAGESFDRISRMASRIFDLPIAAVSLTDSDRQWFKSRVGVDHAQIPRDRAPCAQVAETCDVLVIEDLQADPFYRDSVLGRSGIGFYAGAPLVTRDGFGLGAMCVLGPEPRAATRSEVAALRDLAAMVMSQIELQHAFGRVDPISGLPNRTQFLEDLTDLSGEQGAGRKRIVSLLDLMAVDQLNYAQRVMGPGAIDEIIRTAARNFRALIGPQRRAYHVGATQFACLAPDGIDEVAYVELVSARTEQFCKLGGDTAIGTTVVGIAPFTLGEVSSSEILRIAQGAAQDARAKGLLFRRHSTTSDTAYRRSFALLRDFEAALQAPTSLRLVYQPRVDLGSGRCVGAEALLRWTHPTLGPVSPGEFIPLIERTSLATPTTRHVLETAVAEVARWRSEGLDLPVSVNISPANLHEAGFAAAVQEVLERHGVPASCLELEITETAVMNDGEVALVQLEQLAASGVRLAIDDFGTGYSSLSYLQRLPVHVVKIDRSFMVDLGSAPKRLSLVGMMIAMAKHLGHRVVAEGVETAEVLALLRSTPCDEVQGYIFSKPLEREAFPRWVDARQNRNS